MCAVGVVDVWVWLPLLMLTVDLRRTNSNNLNKCFWIASMEGSLTKCKNLVHNLTVN